MTPWIAGMTLPWKSNGIPPSLTKSWLMIFDGPVRGSSYESSSILVQHGAVESSGFVGFH